MTNPKEESIETIAIRRWLTTLLGNARIHICYMRDAKEMRIEDEAREWAVAVSGTLYVASRIADQRYAKDLWALAAQMARGRENSEYISKETLHEIDQVILSIREEISST